MTYQQCYGAVDVADEPIAAPGAGLNKAIHQGALVAQDAGGELVRRFAVVTEGESEGAYELNIGTGLEERLAYCTGRGVVTASLLCQLNKCDDTTPDYVTVGTAASAGDFCYHTCFEYDEFKP